jgi:hypothetical protein
VTHLNWDSDTLAGRTEVYMPHPGCQWSSRMLEGYHAVIDTPAVQQNYGRVDFSLHGFSAYPRIDYATVAGRVVAVSQQGTLGDWCGLFDEVDPAAQQARQFLLHRHYIEQTPLGPAGERDEHVHVTVRARVITHHRTKERQFCDLPLTAEGCKP